jgi:hypothetical protein
MPFLWQHDHEHAGRAGPLFDKPTKKRNRRSRQSSSIPIPVESATLKDRLQMAWDSVKDRLVRAVSIGFRPLEWAFMDNGGIRYDESEVYELSESWCRPMPMLH